MMKRLRAWIYSRTDTQRNAEDILKDLEQQLYDYAEERGFLIVGSSRDTGSGLGMNRSGIHKVIKAANERKMDILLVNGMDSIGRDTAETLEFLRGLDQLGISLYSPQEGEISLLKPQTLFLG